MLVCLKKAEISAGSIIWGSKKGGRNSNITYSIKFKEIKTIKYAFCLNDHKKIGMIAETKRYTWNPGSFPKR